MFDNKSAGPGKGDFAAAVVNDDEYAYSFPNGWSPLSESKARCSHELPMKERQLRWPAPSVIR